MNWRRLCERTIEALIFVSGVSSVIFVFGIFLFVFLEGAGFLFGRWIGHGERHRVAESGSCVREIDAVLLEVLFGLLLIPFESRHIVWYVRMYAQVNRAV